LIDEAAFEIDKINQKRVSKGKDPVEITSVKEKLGMLVIYADRFDEKISKIVWNCGEKSISYCEICGSSGETYKRTVCIKVLCSDCSAKNGFSEKTKPMHVVCCNMIEKMKKDQGIK
jgi:hypothetical protein